MFRKGKGEYTKRERTLLVAFVLLIVAILVITFLLSHDMRDYANITQQSIEERLLTECRAIEEMVYHYEFDEFVIPSDAEKPRYQEITAQLAQYAAEYDLEYVYFMRLVDTPEGQKVQFFLDGDLDSETRYELDYLEEPTELMLQAFSGKAVFNVIGEYEEGWAGLLSAYKPIYNDNGEVIAVVGVDVSDHDIVERKTRVETLTIVSAICLVLLITVSSLMMLLLRKKAQSAREGSYEAEEAKEAAERANEAKSTFLAHMSHEIRTPLNGVLGLIQMALEIDDSVKKREYLENAMNSARHLLQVINNILEISKIESGKLVLERAEASIYEMVKEIEGIMRPPIRQKNQHLNVTVHHGISHVYADRTHLKQVVINLLSNAAKFTPKQGQVSLTVSLIEETEYESTIEFVVQDSGIGIEEQYLAKLFEPFEQGDGKTTRKYGGTGLGLAISKQIIEMMHGDISVESKVGQGSTFTFYVILEKVLESEWSQEQEASDTSEPIVDCTGKTFLIVEDVEINQQIAQYCLEKLGATVEVANNGVEGLHKFIENPERYHMIFMDVQMPVMDGIEATKRIRTSSFKTSKTIPIIAMTAEVFKEDVDKILQAGMNAHVGKPFEERDVVRVILNCLGP